MNNVEYLNREMARGYCYPHLASFCLWLLESDFYKKLSLDQLDRLTEYVGETEHAGDTNVEKEEWPHLVHAELKERCFICDIKGTEAVEDYKLYWSGRD